MLERVVPQARELAEITTRTDTRDYLAHATKQAKSYDDYELIVDIDAHVSESRFWGEICTYIENDVLKQMADFLDPFSLGAVTIVTHLAQFDMPRYPWVVQGSDKST